jgi:hypothetical protein
MTQVSDPHQKHIAMSSSHQAGGMKVEHSGYEQYVLLTVANSTPFSSNAPSMLGVKNLLACSMGIGVLAQHLGG